MENARYKTWVPTMLFVWAQRRVSFGGIPWHVFFDGYWEPGDKDRKGFEIGMNISVDGPVKVTHLDRVIREGFLERMDHDFSEMGFDAPVRRGPLNAETLRERIRLGYLTFYYKNILNPSRYAEESRRLMSWRPRS